MSKKGQIPIEGDSKTIPQQTFKHHLERLEAKRDASNEGRQAEIQKEITRHLSKGK